MSSEQAAASCIANSPQHTHITTTTKAPPVVLIAHHLVREETYEDREQLKGHAGLLGSKLVKPVARQGTG
jgi:hypothetical protein